MSAGDARLTALESPAAGPAAGEITALQALSAWSLLALVDVVVRTVGFDRFYRLIATWPTVGEAPAQSTEAVVARARAAVHRARTYYFKQAWCLQSAAATVCLLRLRGVRAELVIGVCKIPFYAHAWAEVGGEVVINGRPGMSSIYQVITRC